MTQSNRIYSGVEAAGAYLKGLERIEAEERRLKAAAEPVETSITSMEQGIEALVELSPGKPSEFAGLVDRVSVAVDGLRRYFDQHTK